MVKLFSIAILILCLQNVVAQAQFEKIYGGSRSDNAQNIKQTADGGFIIGGNTKSFGQGNTSTYDFYLIKIDANGIQQWANAYGTANMDIANAVDILPNGNYMISGYTINPGNVYYDFAVVLNPSGTMVWQQQFGAAVAEISFDGIATTGNQTVLVGATYQTGDANIYFVKASPTGVLTTSSFITQPGNQTGWAIKRTTDGGYIVCGNSNSPTNGGTDIYLAKTDSNFNLTWQKNFGGVNNDYGYDVIENAGNFYVLGYYDTQTAPALTLIKTDASGNMIWTKHPARNFGDIGNQIIPTTGGFMIAGYTNTLDKANEMLLMKINLNGDTVYTTHFGGSGNDAAFGIASVSTGGFVVSGQYEKATNNQDFYVVRTDANGNPGCPTTTSFTVSPASVCEDQLVSFSNTTVSSQPFTWQMDGNSFASTRDAAQYFSASGFHNISLLCCAVSSAQAITVHPKPATDFTQTINGNSVTFNMVTGLNAQSQIWNFGDGSATSTQASPTHTYTNLGTYWATLTVVNTNGCDSTISKQVVLFTHVSETQTEFETTLFPNPLTSISEINTRDNGEVKLQLMDVTGKIVLQQSFFQNTSIQKDQLQSGIYFLKLIHSNGETEMIKLVVE